MTQSRFYLGSIQTLEANLLAVDDVDTGGKFAAYGHTLEVVDLLGCGVKLNLDYGILVVEYILAGNFGADTVGAIERTGVDGQFVSTLGGRSYVELCGKAAAIAGCECGALVVVVVNAGEVGVKHFGFRHGNTFFSKADSDSSEGLTAAIRTFGRSDFCGLEVGNEVVLTVDESELQSLFVVAVAEFGIAAPEFVAESTLGNYNLIFAIVGGLLVEGSGEVGEALVETVGLAQVGGSLKVAVDLTYSHIVVSTFSGNKAGHIYREEEGVELLISTDFTISVGVCRAAQRGDKIINDLGRYGVAKFDSLGVGAGGSTLFTGERAGGEVDLNSKVGVLSHDSGREYYEELVGLVAFGYAVFENIEGRVANAYRHQTAFSESNLVETGEVDGKLLELTYGSLLFTSGVMSTNTSGLSAHQR